MTASDIAARLVLVEEALHRIELALTPLTPLAMGLIAQNQIAIRASMAESTAYIQAMVEAVPIQNQQLDAITAWLRDRMTGEQLQFQFDDLMFITKQLISLWQGARDEQLLMRSDIRRLAALCEQVLRARADDDEARTAG